MQFGDIDQHNGQLGGQPMFRNVGGIDIDPRIKNTKLNAIVNQAAYGLLSVGSLAGWMIFSEEFYGAEVKSITVTNDAKGGVAVVAALGGLKDVNAIGFCADVVDGQLKAKVTAGVGESFGPVPQLTQSNSGAVVRLAESVLALSQQLQPGERATFTFMPSRDWQRYQAE